MSMFPKPIKPSDLHEAILAQDASLEHLVNNCLASAQANQLGSTTVAVVQLKATQMVHSRLGDILEMLAIKS